MTKLTIHISGEGTAFRKGVMPTEAIAVIEKLKKEGHKIVIGHRGDDHYDLSIDHLSLGAPTLISDDADINATFDWTTAEVLLESEGILPTTPLSAGENKQLDRLKWETK